MPLLTCFLIYRWWKKFYIGSWWNSVTERSFMYFKCVCFALCWILFSSTLIMWILLDGFVVSILSIFYFLNLLHDFLLDHWNLLPQPSSCYFLCTTFFLLAFPFSIIWTFLCLYISYEARKAFIHVIYICHWLLPSLSDQGAISYVFYFSLLSIFHMLDMMVLFGLDSLQLSWGQMDLSIWKKNAHGYSQRSWRQ